MKKLLVITAALTLFAAPAFAVLSNGPHDLSDNGIGTTELCVFCHTPHSALTNAGTTVPLWNINSDAANDYAALDGTPSAMCMACHDGTIKFSDMANPPTKVGGADLTYGSYGNLLDAAGLSNDHPVGITAATYTGTHIPSGKFKAPNNANADASQGVQCFSCHDVHNYTNVPFLRSTNAGSALCLECHVK